MNRIGLIYWGYPQSLAQWHALSKELVKICWMLEFWSLSLLCQNKFLLVTLSCCQLPYLAHWLFLQNHLAHCSVGSGSSGKTSLPFISNGNREEKNQQQTTPKTSSWANDDVDQSLANLFCEGPGSEYFWLYTPQVSVTTAQLSGLVEQREPRWYTNVCVAPVQHGSSYRSWRWTRLGPRTKVFQPLSYRIRRRILLTSEDFLRVTHLGNGDWEI